MPVSLPSVGTKLGDIVFTMPPRQALFYRGHHATLRSAIIHYGPPCILLKCASLQWDIFNNKYIYGLVESTSTDRSDVSSNNNSSPGRVRGSIEYNVNKIGLVKPWPCRGFTNYRVYGPVQVHQYPSQ